LLDGRLERRQGSVPELIQVGPQRAHPFRVKLRHRVLDEILIHVLPVLLGGGERLFGAPGAAADLETIDVSASGQVVNLGYRVMR
jgi:riboflavin biosynthesis pyrimidine reductase